MSNNIAGKTYDWGLLKRVFVYARPYKSAFFWSVFLTLSLAALAPARPYLVQLTLDKYVLNFVLFLVNVSISTLLAIIVSIIGAQINRKG